MTQIKNYFLVIVSILLLTTCKQKKISLASEDPVKISDFIEFFEPLNLPLQFDDAVLKKKDNDSLFISYKVFMQFIPDSLLGKMYGKGVKPKIYAMGKVTDPNKDAYLFVKTAVGEKKAAFVLCFNRKDKFVAGMPVMRKDQDALTMQVAGLDNKFSIIKIVQRKNKDGTVSEGKDVYILNAEGGNFMLILTDPLEDVMPALINPIDTLPRKNKWSAEYVVNKKNLVSIRDGRKPDRILFFIHFETNKGECTGELKGEAVFKSARMAEYHAIGNPCVLRFTFTSSSVSIQETEACGSYRGVRCQFQGTFPRKKETKLKPVKTSAATKK